MAGRFSTSTSCRCAEHHIFFFSPLMALQDEYKNEPGSVVAADYYHAGALLPLSDEEIVRRTKSHMTVCEPGFADANVVDAAVLRFPKAVTQFSPGSWRARPLQTTSFSNLFMAGDWYASVNACRPLVNHMSSFGQPHVLTIACPHRSSTSGSRALPTEPTASPRSERM